MGSFGRAELSETQQQATAVRTPTSWTRQNLCSTSTARLAVLAVSLTARVSRSGWSRSVFRSSLQGPPYSFGSIHLTGRELALNSKRNESSERDRPRPAWPGHPYPVPHAARHRACPAAH